jgi:hypothetical protein
MTAPIDASGYPAMTTTNERNTMSMTTTYDEGFSLGRIHADGRFNLDPRYTMAEHSRRGTLEEFMRGFNDGYEGKEAQP